MFGNYLIGLREGLEAFLIVAVLVAYVVKQRRRDLIKQIALGTLSAVVLSAAAGAVLTFGSQSLTFEAQEALGGTLSIITAAMVTWMVLWMAQNSKSFSKDLQGKASQSFSKPATLFWLSFLTVTREGLETAMFIWSAARSTGSGLSALFASLAGIFTAILLGFAIFKGLIKVNLGKFFQVTGFFLLIVAAGVLAYGIHDLQEAGILPGLHNPLFDVSHIVPLNSPQGTLLKGIFNFSPVTTVFEGAAWLLYVLLIFPLYFMKIKESK